MSSLCSGYKISQAFFVGSYSITDLVLHKARLMNLFVSRNIVGSSPDSNHEVHYFFVLPLFRKFTNCECLREIKRDLFIKGGIVNTALRSSFKCWLAVTEKDSIVKFEMLCKFVEYKLSKSRKVEHHLKPFHITWDCATFHCLFCHIGGVNVFIFESFFYRAGEEREDEARTPNFLIKLKYHGGRAMRCEWNNSQRT